MKVTDPNLAPLPNTGVTTGGTSGTNRTQQTDKTSQGSGVGSTPANGAGSGDDDVHLSELVRSLRSLAADSPERQAQVEQIARAYANGTYQVNAQATASKIIDDAQQH
jgi:flagellar biosynthesis anti-sigma factor FlgM